MSGVMNVLMGSGQNTFRAVINRDSLYGFATGRGAGVTSLSVTCSPINGTGPFTYVWSRVSGDTAIYPHASGSDTTFFGAYLPDSGDYFEAIWKCTITDANLSTAESPNVTITLERVS